MADESRIEAPAGREVSSGSRRLPPLTSDLLPETLSACEVTRIVALESRALFLELELGELQARLADAENQLRGTKRDLGRERIWNRHLRTEFKRLVRWLDQIQEQVVRLYTTRRWKTASLLHTSTVNRGLDAVLARYAAWKLHRPTGAGLDGRIDSYATWLAEQRPSIQKRIANAERIEHMAAKPVFGLVLDLREDDTPADIAATVASVCAQTFEGWRLGILTDVKGMELGLPEDKRITTLAADDLPEDVTHLAGISKGDTLEPRALESIVLSFDDRALPADFIYTDEDEIDALGGFGNPFLKPNWSPDTMESAHYTGALAVYRRDFLQSLGLGLGALNPARAYATILLASEASDFRVRHIPQVLYHRRESNEKSRVQLAEMEMNSLRAALDRRGCRAEVHHGSMPGLFQVRRRISCEEKTSILIPTRDGLSLLKRCIESLTRKTAYMNYEITIINNGSREAATLDYLATCGHRIFDFPGPFNYAAMHNAAVAASDSPWLLFLNNDTEVLNPEWLHVMAEHVQRPEIAAVGAKLLFPGGTVQHAGVVLGIQQRAVHAFAGDNPASLAARGQLQMVRNYSAVTAACMMIRREVFDRLGGFDAERFPIAYNDVELCVRALKFGYRNIYAPLAVLKHHECATRSRRDNYNEVQNLHQTCFGPPGWTDPFYHPSFNQDIADFRIAGL